MEFPSDSIDVNHNEMISTFKDDDSPQQQINEQSIAEALEKNRESLKRKLESRRSLKQLVEVGIMPSPKTPVPFYEQGKKLQMKRTQDMLKNKIISRPDRQLLIEHNILSDTIAAPAIQNTQRQLKRARLADNLNDKIATRPGVLELVANNILEMDSNLKEAIKGGRIQFPSTKSNSSSVPDGSPSSSSEDPLTNPTVSSIPQAQRPLRPKTASSSSMSNGLNNLTSRRSANTNSKFKSSLTFHEYKGPSQKVEVTKVPLQPTRSLIVQPVQATLVPLVPLEAHSTLSENQYRIRLQQQKLFLELQNTNNNVKTGDVEHSNDSSDLDHDDNPIGNLLKQPIDETVHMLSNIPEEICSFEKMKLADLKNQCRKLNLSTSGTKTKLIEKLRNATVTSSDTTSVPSSTSTNDSTALHSSTSSIQLLLSSSSLSDQELYHQQQQKIVELENQLEKLKHLDPYGVHSSLSTNQFDSSNTIPQKCHPAVSAQIHKRILIQQQEKLKQKMQDEQQHLLQQNPIVPLTPESVARFLASQSQSQLVQSQPWSMHHSTSAPSFLHFSEIPHPNSSSPSNPIEAKSSDEEAILSLLDDYTDGNSGLSFFLDHSLSDPADSFVNSTTSAQTMDWVSLTSPSMITDFNYDNNLDFSQYFNPIGTEHHILYDQTTSTCQQSSNTHSFDLFSPSSPMI